MAPSPPVAPNPPVTPNPTPNPQAGFGAATDPSTEPTTLYHPPGPTEPWGPAGPAMPTSPGPMEPPAAAPGPVPQTPVPEPRTAGDHSTVRSPNVRWVETPPAAGAAPPHTGPPVAGPSDIGSPDTAPIDTGSPDTGSPNTAPTKILDSPVPGTNRFLTRARAAVGVRGLSADFSLRHLFGKILERRTQDEVEQALMVGTARTTPSLAAVDVRWPQPWLFARAFLATASVFLLLFVGWTLFEPPTLLPGLIIVGSLSMPITALIFFFEMNLARNVSIVAVLRLVFLGGAASLLFSLIGFELLDFAWLAVVAAPIMEAAKLLVVVLMARQARHRQILNGMLFGAAVGAGVAAFEAAGYALVAALFNLDTAAVIDAIIVRGVFSPFTHVVWTAMTAGALWRVRGSSERLRFGHLRSRRFWPIMVLVIAIHALWISPIPNPLYLKSLVIGLVAWPVCLGLLQEGITELRDRQRAAA